MRWACFLLALASLCAPAQAPGQELWFLILSDPQFGMYTNNADFAQETANFSFAIATANRLHPAFVVVCGDLTNKAGDPAQVAEYQRVAHLLDRAIPIYNVAGNHDVGNEPTPASLAAYRRNYGADYYTFRAGNLEGIVLNSSLIQHPENAPEEAEKQRAWLETALREAQQGGRQAVVFQHIPWLLKSADEPDQYFNIPSTTRARYLALFEQYGVHHVFAGHYHRNAEGRSAALEVTTTGPVGKPLGVDPSGIRVARVKGGSVTSEYFGFGNLPNQLTDKAGR